jgi:F0F1-type ATP synthase membrane subunit c/vacuolar-type H+-ATPase subunit K
MASIHRAAVALIICLAGIASAHAAQVAAGTKVTTLVAQPFCADRTQLQGYITAVMNKDDKAVATFTGCQTIAPDTDYVVIDPGKPAVAGADIAIGKVKLTGKGDEGWTMIVPND